MGAVVRPWAQQKGACLLIFFLFTLMVIVELWWSKSSDRNLVVEMTFARIKQLISSLLEDF